MCDLLQALRRKRIQRNVKIDSPTKKTICHVILIASTFITSSLCTRSISMAYTFSRGVTNPKRVLKRVNEKHFQHSGTLRVYSRLYISERRCKLLVRETRVWSRRNDASLRLDLIFEAHRSLRR